MQIKGNVLISRINFVKQNLGEDGWLEILQSLSSVDREFLSGFLTPVGWYPYGLGQRLENAIVRFGGKAGRKVFEEMGAASARLNLTTVHRHFIEGSNPQSFLAKAGTIFRFYYDKGWREYTQTGPTSGTLTTHASESFSENDCFTVMGWYKEALVMCGAKDPVIVEDQCRARGDDVCRYQITWR